MYEINTESGEKIEFMAIADVKLWIRTRGLYMEANANLRGIRTTLANQGEVALYATDNPDDDFAVAKVTRPQNQF